MQWEKDRVRQGTTENRALSLNDLDIPFAELPVEHVSLAYHQRAVLGSYVLTAFGFDLMRETLRSLADGAPVSDAMRAALGSDVGDIERRLFAAAPVPPPTSNPSARSQ